MIHIDAKNIDYGVTLSEENYKTVDVFRQLTNENWNKEEYAIMIVRDNEQVQKANKYNVREAYLYDIEYPYDVVVLPEADQSLPIHTITTNDGLILIFGTTTNGIVKYRLYDLFATEDPASEKFDSELLDADTIYKSTPSLAPLEEHVSVWFKGSKAAYTSLLVAGHQEGKFTMCVGCHDIVKLPIPLYTNDDETYTKLDGATVAKVDTNYYTVSGVYDDLYTDTLVLPNKPYYRIMKYSTGTTPTILINGSQVESKMIQTAGDVVVVKNPIYVSNEATYINIGFKMPSKVNKMLLGVI